jgi:integrase
MKINTVQRSRGAVTSETDVRRAVRGAVTSETDVRRAVSRSVTSETDVSVAKSRGRGAENWLFRMSDGSKVVSLIDQFNKVLELGGIRRNARGETYSLYCLRHFYAVQMLRSGRVGVFDIARNMGTSVQIIEAYYGKHATPQVLATRLGG